MKREGKERQVFKRVLKGIPAPMTASGNQDKELVRSHACTAGSWENCVGRQGTLLASSGHIPPKVGDRSLPGARAKQDYFLCRKKTSLGNNMSNKV